MSTGRDRMPDAPLIYYAGDPENWEVYARALPEALRAEGVAARLVNAPPDPEAVDYLVFDPAGPVSDFAPYTRAKALLGLWAGVEKIVGNPTITQPLCRMVDPGLERGMTEWVAGHVLRHHLGMDTHILHQDGVWRNRQVPPLAAERPVAILGMGALGRAAAAALTGLGFPVTGWSRTESVVPGVVTRYGPDALAGVLADAQILVLLLPLTAETQGLLDAARLALLPEGAVIVNPGRGPLIDDAALLAALESGRIGHATLDVFAEEPLPPGHPYWAHPRVTVTPHIASTTRPESAARVVARNIARGEAGLPFLHLVDRSRGY